MTGTGTRNRKPTSHAQTTDNTRETRTFALIRDFSFADFVTLGNAVCGSLSIFLCLNYLENEKYHPYIVGAFFLLPLALLCDILDGYFARCRQRFSIYGADLDSLADLISFGVAPNVLGFTLGLRGLWDSAILCANICMGLSRLARYNVTAEALTAPGSQKVSYFEGFPIPSNLLSVVLLGIAYFQDSVGPSIWGGEYFILVGHFHPFSLVYLFFGCMMVSTIRIPKP